MSSRSQRAKRYRDGVDSYGTAAYALGERSLQTPAVQRALSIADGLTPPAANTVLPAVTGTTTVGEELSVTTGTWTDEGTPSYAYQWYRSNTPIAGATASTHTIVAADAGYLLMCKVTITDDYGVASVFSNMVGPVAPIPINTVAPVISGADLVVGTVWTTTDGTWTVTGTPAYTYQWMLDDVAIEAATADTYTLLIGDVDGMITCVVTATDDNGAASATSNEVGPVVAAE